MSNDQNNKRTIVALRTGLANCIGPKLCRALQDHGYRQAQNVQTLLCARDILPTLSLTTEAPAALCTADLITNRVKKIVLEAGFPSSFEHLDREMITSLKKHDLALQKQFGPATLSWRDYISCGQPENVKKWLGLLRQEVVTILLEYPEHTTVLLVGDGPIMPMVVDPMTTETQTYKFTPASGIICSAAICNKEIMVLNRTLFAVD
jgi:phosphohistidine phosphatase SixA